VSDADRARQALDRLGIAEPDSPVLALCPGAEFGSSKRWPATHFAALARQALAGDWNLWLFGGPNDRAVARAVAASLDAGPGPAQRAVSLVGRTSLDDAIDLMSLTSAVVSNDSGLMHIAAALGKPLVALYGSSSPEFTPPLAELAATMFTDIDCRPCFARECRFGHTRCLTQLRPDDVYAKLQVLLDSRSNGSALAAPAHDRRGRAGGLFDTLTNDFNPERDEA
jgi:heptosyltransferase-2